MSVSIQINFAIFHWNSICVPVFSLFDFPSIKYIHIIYFHKYGQQNKQTQLYRDGYGGACVITNHKANIATQQSHTDRFIVLLPHTTWNKTNYKKSSLAHKGANKRSKIKMRCERKQSEIKLNKRERKQNYGNGIQ